MIRKIQLLIISAAVALSATACLDKEPEGAIRQGEAIRTLSDANQAVIGIYAGFKSSSLYSGLLTLCPDIQADLVHAVEGYTNTYGDIWRWEILSNNTEITAVYAALYSLIGQCNFFLDYVEPLRASLTLDSELDSLDGLESEVHLARALCYSELIKLYCKAYDPATAEDELGVAIITSYLNPGRPTRTNLKASYEFVLDELTKAEEYIDDRDVNNSHYFTLNLVNALYARVYLYMQDWDNAIKYSSKVIASTGLRLSSASQAYGSTGQSQYQYMWTNDAATEIIWKVGFTTSSYGGALGRVFANYDFTSLPFKPDYVPSTWALNIYSKDDRRYESFFQSVTTGHTHNLTWPVLIKYYGNQTFIAQNMMGINMPKVFRLSEQYLIRAEAYCQKQEFAKASQDITTLRGARYTSFGSVTLSESNWLNTISEERVRELYMEGFRLQDLKRWHRGFERTAQANSVSPGNTLKIEADDPLFVWPIPQHELDTPDADIQPNESNK